MKNLELRSALVKSGALLALCIFLIYAFAAGDSGGVGGTVNSLLSAIVFVVGLTVAVILSISIIFGIYFGVLYLYDPKVSKKTYEELRTIGNTFSAKLTLAPKCCASHKAEAPAPAPAVSTEDLQAIEASQTKLSAQLVTLASTIETLQKSLSNFTSDLGTAKEEISALEEKTSSLEEAIETKAPVEAVDDASKKLNTELEGVKSSIKPLADKVTALEENIASLSSQDETAPEGEDVQELINNALGTLKGEIEAVKSEIALLNTPPPEPEPKENKSKNTNDNSDTTHRILSYFENESDKNTFIESVKEAVDQGMTYAQIGEFVEKALSKEAAGVISGHPSLTKDYIRTIRQQS